MKLAFARSTRDAARSARTANSAAAKRSAALERLTALQDAPAKEAVASALIADEAALPATALTCSTGWLESAFAVSRHGQPLVMLPVGGRDDEAPGLVDAQISVVFYDADAESPKRLGEVAVGDLELPTKWTSWAELIALAGDALDASAKGGRDEWSRLWRSRREAAVGALARR